MTTMLWPQITPHTLADQVYHAIRDRILDGHLSAGEFIREQEVNQLLGVSRTPIREALFRLASEGFVERLPHRGFRVVQAAFKGLMELYPILSALELLASKLSLPQLDDADIAQLEALNDQLREAAEREDVPAVCELNNQFHHAFCARSGNQRLNDLLDELRLQALRLDTWYFSSPQRTARSIAEHADIVAAIRTGDFESALSKIERNFALTHKILQEKAEASFE
jgi:DNA-binding GntR family transcriptional regulator